MDIAFDDMNVRMARAGNAFKLTNTLESFIEMS